MGCVSQEEGRSGQGSFLDPPTKRGDKIKEESNNLDIPTAFKSVYMEVFLWEVLTFETGQDHSFHQASAWLISGVTKPTFLKHQRQKR